MTDAHSLSPEPSPTNITVLRRLNLIALRQQFAEEQIAKGASPTGLAQAFAQQLQISPSLLSQVLASRPIGDNLARQIESLSFQPMGWLDEAQEPDLADPSEERFVQLARSVWAKATKAERKGLMEMLKTTDRKPTITHDRKAVA